MRMACCGGVCSGVGGAGGVLRVRLCFDYPPPGLVQCRMSWVLLDLRECRVITDVASVIREKFQYSGRTQLELYLQDCYLPPTESALLLRDSDTLRVKVYAPDPTVRKRRREEEEEEESSRGASKKNREGGAAGEPKTKHKKQKKKKQADEEPSSSRSENVPESLIGVNGKDSRGGVAPKGVEPSSEEEEPPPLKKSPKIKKRPKPPKSSPSTKTLKDRPAGSTSKNKASSSTVKKPSEPRNPPTVPPKSSSSSSLSKPGNKTLNPSSSSSSSSSSDENKAPFVKRKSTISIKPSSSSQDPPRPRPPTSTDSSSEEEEESRKSARNTPKSISTSSATKGEPTKPPTKISTGPQTLKKKPQPSPSSSSGDEVPPEPPAPAHPSSSGPLENGSAPVGKNLPNLQQQNGAGDSDSSESELVIKRPNPQLILMHTPRGRGRGVQDRARSRGGGRGGFGRARGTPWKQDFHHTYQHEEKHQRDTLSNTSVLLQNPPAPVLRRDYETLPLLAAPPAVGTKIAFKLLELTENYTPEVSDYKEGKVVGLNPTTSMIELELLTKSHTPAEPGKFDLVYQNPDGSEHVEYAVTLGSQLTERWESLLEPRLILDQTTTS